HHLVQEGVVHAFVHEDSLGCAAHLPGTEESAEDRALSSALEIGVLTDDHRPVAARFDQRALETRGPDDLLRGRVRTDEADAIDAAMRHEPLADVTAAVDDVDDSLGKPRVR